MANWTCKVLIKDFCPLKSILSPIILYATYIGGWAPGFFNIYFLKYIYIWIFIIYSKRIYRFLSFFLSNRPCKLFSICFLGFWVDLLFYPFLSVMDYIVVLNNYLSYDVNYSL